MHDARHEAELDRQRGDPVPAEVEERQLEVGDLDGDLLKALGLFGLVTVIHWIEPKRDYMGRLERR